MSLGIWLLNLKIYVSLQSGTFASLRHKAADPKEEEEEEEEGGGGEEETLWHLVQFTQCT
jgi:hypothetical protein